MRTLRRRIVALAGAMVLLTALASPALANPQETGTQYCQTGWTPYARGESTHSLRRQVPEPPTTSTTAGR